MIILGVTTWPSNSTSRYIPKRNDNICHSKTGTWLFLAALFIISPKWEQSKCPSLNERINKICYMHIFGFPGGSDSKESTCNVGDTGWIRGSGRSPGEGIRYPLQYSWASLVAQTVKNPPAMQETGFNPGSGRSLEGGNGNPLQYSCLGNPMDREVWRATVHGITKSQRWLKWLCPQQHKCHSLS